MLIHPSPMNQSSFITSLPYRTCCVVTSTSKTGPILMFCSITPYGSALNSSRVLVYSRHVFVTPTSFNKSAGLVTKYCLLSFDVFYKACIAICPAIFILHGVISASSAECNRFLRTDSRKSRVSCSVSWDASRGGLFQFRSWLLS